MNSSEVPNGAVIVYQPLWDHSYCWVLLEADSALSERLYSSLRTSSDSLYGLSCLGPRFVLSCHSTCISSLNHMTPHKITEITKTTLPRSSLSYGLMQFPLFFFAENPFTQIALSLPGAQNVGREWLSFPACWKRKMSFRKLKWLRRITP
jgi:hypothetical protein